MVLLWHVFLGVLIIIAIVAVITRIVTIYINYSLKKAPHTILLGRLNDNLADDSQEAMKYLKLTNSIKG